MDFQTVTRLSILVQFMLALCSEAVLPSKDRLVVGRCLQQSIEPVFNEIRKEQTPAEFLGTFCIELAVKEIERKFVELNKDIVTETKDCLAKKNLKSAFDAYFIEGEKNVKQQSSAAENEILAQQPPTEQEERHHHHQQQQSPVLMLPAPELENPKTLTIEWPVQQQTTSIIHSGLEPTNNNQIVLAHPPAEPSRVTSTNPFDEPPINHPVTTTNPFADPPNRTSKNPFEESDERDQRIVSEENITTFALFANGLCNSKELISFSQLTDDKDKKQILHCCENCVMMFFGKIQHILETELEILRNQRKPENQNEIDGMTMPELDTFMPTCDYVKVKNIEDISNVGENWIEIYNTIYNEINKQYLLTKNISIDEALSNAYFDYESCIQWGCALKNSHDVPLHEWITENAKVPKNTLFRVLIQEPEPTVSDTPNDVIQNGEQRKIEHSGVIKNEDEKLKVDSKNV